MKWYAGLTIGLSILRSLQSCEGYKIDESCRRPFGQTTNDYKMIQKAMRNAFTMAQWASDEVEKHGNDRSDQVNRLIRILFCKKNEDPKTAALPHLRNILKGVLTLRDQTKTPDHKDVTVYCNDERIETSKRTLQSHLRRLHWDKYEKVWLDSPGDVLTECLSKRSVGLAVTLNPTAPDEIHGGEIRYTSQIQVCRWFLEWSREPRYKVWDDISKRAATAHLGVAWSTHGWPLTEFDAWTLLDKVLLHELTHTTSANTAVDCRKGFHFPQYPFRYAYGWKAARILAKKEEYPMTVQEVNINIPPGYPGHYKNVVHKSETNADSIALFASAINLLRREGGPKFVKLNGEITLDPPDHNEGGSLDDLKLASANASFYDVLRQAPEDNDSEFDKMLDLLEMNYNEQQMTDSDTSAHSSDSLWDQDEDDFENDSELDSEDNDQNFDGNAAWDRDSEDDLGIKRVKQSDPNFGGRWEDPMDKSFDERGTATSASDEIFDDSNVLNATSMEDLDQEGAFGAEHAGFLSDVTTNMDEPDQEGDQGVEFAGFLSN